ncbi:MAG: type II secretion system F family protein [Omnitrophica bacterium]|nr:type II secretion system F family protein [Candidatus Omnitrophota bacterium]
MPIFKYVAKDAEGKTLKGIIEAPAKEGAIQSMRAKNLIIVSLDEERKDAGRSRATLKIFRKKIKLDDLVVFSRQLATMIDAGIPLVGALDILEDQIENPSFKEVLSKTRDSVETGSSLSEALAKHPDVFSELFVNMTRAGESSGMLDEILDRLALYLEKTSNLQRKVKSALVYPAVISCMAFSITIFLMVKVIPMFSEIYAGFGAELPMPTQVVMNISGFLQKYFYVVIAIAAIGGFLSKRYTKTKKGRLLVDKLKLNMPVFGILMKKVAVAKFTRTLSTLTKSGVPILDSLEIVGKTAGNTVVEKAVADVRTNVREGEPIAAPLARSGIFPVMVVRMISVGEQTGELEKMLSKVSDFYDEQVDAAVSGLTSLIEPLIIAFLGIVIGGIVICMFLPILQISSAVGT